MSLQFIQTGRYSSLSCLTGCFCPWTSSSELGNRRETSHGNWRMISFGTLQKKTQTASKKTNTFWLVVLTHVCS